MNILVIGGSGGVGLALVKIFCDSKKIVNVTATYRTHRPTLYKDRLNWVQADITEEDAIIGLFVKCPDLTYIINAVGLLHSSEGNPEKAIAQLQPEFFIDNIRVNTLSTLLIAKHAHKSMKKAPKSVLAVLSARVGSISDNRAGGWYSYRCSKAALNMAVKTLSIEWKRTLPNCAVVALHPGTVKTQLSAAFARRIPDSKLFTPEQSAQWLAEIICRLEPNDTGKFIAYDGSKIEW